MTERRACRTKLYLAVLPFLMVPLGACGLTAAQKEAVATFGTASKDYGELVVTELPQMRNGIMEMQAASLALPGARSSSDFAARKFTNLDRNLDQDDLTRPMQLALALRSYGQGLVDLVGDGNPDAVKQHMSSIGDNLAKLPGFAEDGDRIKAVAGKAGPVASLAVENVKRDAVIDIVRAFAPTVDKAADLLAGEFRVSGNTSLAAYESAARGLDISLRDAFDTINAPNRRASMPASDRWLFVNADRMHRNHKAHIATLDQTGGETAAKLKKAHAALLAAVEDRAYSIEDIRQFAREVQTLYALVRAFG
ncbi:hypothetical protein [Azospirillum soli]|uniref:hypothetical protein n=1 Tax=Azospirillum soli TaxID=1304799 RepID=UPI001AE118C2|nr:hypothetical protein [Azospirillum soli]MBP2315304.1 hypothetical protein [Azospirillum soli]